MYTREDKAQRDNSGWLHQLFTDERLRRARQVTQVAKKFGELVMHEQKVLVTGGAGYIGSHACKALKQAGFTPVTFDNLVTGWTDAVKFGPFEHG